jgi:hypothetical protein
MQNDELRRELPRRHGGSEVKWSCKGMGAGAAAVLDRDISVKSVLSVVKGLEIR